ncbi:glycosyl hydrolase family 28-related protein [Paenibacillus chungangensis]|uniref:Glycosyl hydrolase family 28-related protein n=1 Tax=Paenibacillus chungangensis TaxID=696535 RepID=A0ABW3HT16_9BACL
MNDNRKTGINHQNTNTCHHEDEAGGGISRRKLLATLGTAGIALAASQALPFGTGTAQAAARITVYNVADYGAAGDGITDDTNAINLAISAAYTAGGGIVYIPNGVYLVDPSPSKGIALKRGIWLLGEGENVSVLSAKPTGGSVIRRDFHPSGPNDYLQDLFIGHLAIVLNHPTTASPSNYEQIGFDFRNITRSTIFECYVGNYVRGGVSKTEGVWEDMAQGYGIVFGNVSSSSPAYAGGEVNSAVRCEVWGAKKAIVLDDSVLSPASAAHATTIDNCDVQICELGIGTESRYTAGLTFNNNIVQTIIPARGSTATTYCYRIDGYGCRLEGGYVEATTANHVVYLGSLSKRNWVELGYYTSNGAITDLGAHNRIQYLHHTNGRLIDSFNQVVNSRAWATFDASGSLLAGSGVASVTRVGAGDFQINWSFPYPTNRYAVSFSNNVDASGNAGLVTIRSQTASNVRIHTYKVLSGGTVTQTDFQAVTVTAELF